ncbi:AmmeMemoRadiSam system protein B [Maribellus sediminis]|uniref:AmmeMemoRadiSam system protein B n=1 Tax=Maribellus sediminis TaxID=2696285 RepID=UPI0014312D7D|nr:AmmeMemoRadiSam system protein B [Maribellus sediminis]
MKNTKMNLNALFSFLVISILFSSCSSPKNSETGEARVRQVVDTVGFAHLSWQMDSVLFRINKDFGSELDAVSQSTETPWRAAICPHDDYTYASWLYPAVLKNIEAKTVIIFGVAHRALNFKLEDRIVFDSFDAWQGPKGEVQVSPLRDKIIQQLPEELYVVHDSMQMIEHSVESMLPFLQMQNPETEIISILVPFMSSAKMETIAGQLATAIKSVTSADQLVWGKDFSILITTDAVHYGDEEWGGSNYARFGCDSTGYRQAVALEREIIHNCFTGELTDEQPNRFISYTVKDDDFRQYKWTWCGRYSVPLGLKVALKLQQEENATPLTGVPLGYETSISQKHIPVDDLNMGRTAIATPHHWVGYAAVGFK